MAYSVLIAENSEIIRRGMVDILQASGLFERIREQGCAANLNEMIQRLQPDVLIINPSMVDAGFRENLKNSAGIRPRLVAIVYSFHDDAIMELFDETIPINNTRARIIRKLSDLLKKETPGSSAADNQLTARETDVLKLLVQGFSNKEVSGQLFISTHTVMSHRKKITQKLNIKSMAGLTVYAILNGIISMDQLR